MAGIHDSSNTLYQCTNVTCDAVFAHPDTVLYFGEYLVVCPECYDPYIMILQSEVVYSLFYHIIGHDWDEKERMALRVTAEEQMAPYDPRNRDR